MPRVLIVEDEDAMAVALKDGFEYDGHEVLLARDGVAAYEMASKSAPDLMILDVMLPKMSGLDVCKKLRADGSKLPILMLTARGQEIDKVLGLKLGADDYVTKPFSFMELAARVEALLRRSGNGKGDGKDGVYRVGELEVKVRAGVATRKGKPLDLSSREFHLLAYLLQHRGEVISRDRLLNAVWGYDAAPLTRTVDMHVAKLRKKLGDDAADSKYIVTVHGMGYRFNA
ncbi:MAG: response regulator transcription factor [Acidobacteriota bacterium]